MASQASANTLASPQCSVDIWPFEGGQWSISGQTGQILECTISKSIRAQAGQWQVVLAPGGPLSTGGGPSWTQVLTPQSLVVIALARGSHANVVMVGLIEEIEDDLQWKAGESVLRAVRISGRDWARWFLDFNWSALAFLGAGLAPQANALVGGASPESTFANLVGQGAANGNPSQIGQFWYTKIMAGASGFLTNTAVQYRGQPLAFNSATSYAFESYPWNAIFPFSSMFVAGEGSWYGKFADIFDFPFYEFWIGSAPSGQWTSSMATGAQISSGINPGQSASPSGPHNATSLSTSLANVLSATGQLFSSIGIPSAVPAQAIAIARVNPLPDLAISTSPTSASTNLAGQPSFAIASGAQLAKWAALASAQPDGDQGVIESTVGFGQTDYFNVFVLNPTYVKYLLNLSSVSPGIFPFAYVMAANVAGIRRYGLRAMVRDTGWYSDVQGVAASASGNIVYLALGAALTTRLASFYTPLPVMARGSVRTPLRPDIFPGTRWQFAPFRDGASWQFYVLSVRHRWAFGGPSTTELALERGLESTVYANGALMANVLTGNAMRQNGKLVSGVPTGVSGAPALQTFTGASGPITQFLGQIAQVLVTPQGQ